MRRGFTLMEVLVSVALLLVLSGVIFAFLRDVLASRDRVTEVTARQRLAATIIERIEEQAMFSLVGDAAFGSGIRGDESSITILSRGVAASETGHAETWHEAFFDLTRTEYRFDETTHTVQVRRETPRIVTDSGENDQATPSRSDPSNNSERPFDSFDNRVYLIRFRYHDGSEWRSSFDSLEADRLPRAIEIAIWFDPWPDSDWSDDDGQDMPAGFDDVEQERLTFDMEGVFDEMEHAMRADRDFRPPPPPDRIRVITIPDADEDSFDVSVEGA